MKWSEQNIPDLSGKRALVTGGASGIGLAAVRGLALHGAEVLIADRNTEAGQAACAQIRAEYPKAKLDFLALDLSSLQNVRRFAQTLLDQGQTLDLLINNAGINPISERRTTVDGFELTFGIGHLGHFALTGLLWPLLLQSAAPRVVTVSSVVHKLGSFDWDDLQMAQHYNTQRPYNQTKLANLVFARELQRRATAAGLPLLSLAVHPGVSRTNIGAARKAMGNYNVIDHMVSGVLAAVMKVFGQSAEAGGLPTLYAATSPTVSAGGFYGPDGFAEMKGAPAPAKAHRVACHQDTATRLWLVSEQLTGVRFAGLPS